MEAPILYFDGGFLIFGGLEWSSGEAQTAIAKLDIEVKMFYDKNNF